jgi:hypothetical protein
VKALLTLALLLAATPLAAGAATHQSLSIVLHARDASTLRLPHYRTASPIAVRVAGDAGRYDAVTIVANGPGGIAIRTPLARTDDGFAGALRLGRPGTWTIDLTAQLGSVSDAIAGIPLDVEAPDGSTTAGYAGFVLAALMLVSGALMIVRRRLAFAAPIALRVPRKRS